MLYICLQIHGEMFICQIEVPKTGYTVMFASHIIPNPEIHLEHSHPAHLQQYYL